MSLEAVETALAEEDHEVALIAAVKTWRAARHAVLAELVEAIATRCAPPPVAGRDKDRYQRAWLGLAARVADNDDPAAVGALLAGLVKSLPVRQVRYLAPQRDVKRQRPFLDRIAALARCADDPRIASTLMTFIEKAPISVDDASGVYGPALDLLVRIADERSIAQLRALVARPLARTATLRDYFADALPRAAAQIEERLRRRRRLPTNDRSRATVLLAKFRAPAPPGPSRVVDTAKLIEECIAQFDDDGPREVLADALLEREDPRGEFIALQLRDARRELGDADRKRMAALLRKHEKAWIGDVTRITKLRVWRRGFLDEAELLQGAAADERVWSQLANDPVLATIRTLHKGNASEELYALFVLSPAMRSLRDIEVPSTWMLAELAQRTIEHAILHTGLGKGVLAIIDDVATRARIRRLTIAVKKQSPRELVEQLAAWSGRERFIELSAAPSFRLESWSGFPSTWMLAFDALSPVRRIGLRVRGAHVVVERGRRGLIVEANASADTRLLALLRSKQPIERLVVRGTIDSWSTPTAQFTNAVRKLPAAELYDDWLPYAPSRC